MIEWDIDKINFLKNNLDKSIKELSEIIGYSRPTIREKLKDLNLYQQKNKPKRRCDFSDEQEKFIRDNYLLLKYKDIAKILGKNEASIRLKVSSMGLELKSEKWSEKELALLKELYPKYSNKYLSENFFVGRTPECINVLANKLNLYKNNKNWFTEEELIQILKDYAKAIGRTPLYSELIGNDKLPSLSTYARYFGSFEKACVRAGLELNICLFGEYTKKLIALDGETICLSNAELVVTNFMLENNIKFEKEKHYSEILDKNYGFKRCDWYLNDYNVIVEYFGLLNKEEYRNKAIEKEKICQTNGIKLISISDKQINNYKLNNIFKEYIHAQ